MTADNQRRSQSKRQSRLPEQIEADDCGGQDEANRAFRQHRSAAGTTDGDKPRRTAMLKGQPEQRQRQRRKGGEQGVGIREVGRPAQHWGARDDDAGEQPRAAIEQRAGQFVATQHRGERGERRGKTGGEFVDAEELVGEDLQPVDEGGLVIAELAVEGGNNPVARFHHLESARRVAALIEIPQGRAAKIGEEEQPRDGEQQAVVAGSAVDACEHSIVPRGPADYDAGFRARPAIIEERRFPARPSWG